MKIDKETLASAQDITEHVQSGGTVRADGQLTAAVKNALAEPVRVPSEHSRAFAGILTAYEAAMFVQSEQVDRRIAEVKADFDAEYAAAIDKRDSRLAALEAERRDIERTVSGIGHATQAIQQ